MNLINKIKRTKLSFIFLFVFLIGCSMINYDSNGLSPEAKMLYSFIGREGKKIGKKYHMSQLGVGGGIDKGINLMCLDFSRKGENLTQPKARELIVSCVNDYLLTVNEDEKLRPYLANYPFKPENIDFTIYNKTLEGKNTFHPFISVIKAKDGEITYHTDDPENNNKIKTTEYENYEEALKIVQGS